ncbi:hypothetical protein [Natronomonas sp. LN261]|uniref:hypothetical protein n=1 Tax=Natronomonas sp. LN261 TaxID=2750669 RepID=UPI0015EEC0D2|nr:hypothetical protein [Natronomonas sp. LN261]
MTVWPGKSAAGGMRAVPVGGMRAVPVGGMRAVGSIEHHDGGGRPWTIVEIGRQYTLDRTAAVRSMCN